MLCDAKRFLKYYYCDNNKGTKDYSVFNDTIVNAVGSCKIEEFESSKERWALKLILSTKEMMLQKCYAEKFYTGS